MQARARLTAELDPAGRSRLSELRSEAPISFRPVSPSEVWMVASAAGPLGDDSIGIDVTVGRGAELLLRATGATIALGARGWRSSLGVRAGVADGGSLSWLPEPLIVTGGADHSGAVAIELAGNARMLWREEVLLGRSGEEPGDCELRLRVDRAGHPLLRHHLAVGPSHAGWRSVAGVGAYRAIGLALAVGMGARLDRAELYGPRCAALPLEVPDAVLVTAVADDAIELRELLDAALGSLPSRFPGPALCCP